MYSSLTDTELAAEEARNAADLSVVFMGFARDKLELCHEVRSYQLKPAQHLIRVLTGVVQVVNSKASQCET